MTPFKIAFFDTKRYDKEFFQAANREYNFEIKYFDSHLTKDTAILAQGFSVVCVFVNDQIDAPLIEILHRLGIKLIALRCAGYNNVDLPAAQDKISVVRVPDYSPYAVAEHAVGMMMTLNRKLHLAYHRTRDNNFSIAGLLGFDMHGKTAGIIGAGHIGRIVIQILKGLGMRVLSYDIDPALVKEAGAEYADLDALFEKSDIISLHCPLTPQNHHMINNTALAKMKKGVMLINTGRGGLIDTSDLLENLKNQKIGAAGLDVYEEESGYFYEDFSHSFISDDLLARLLTFPNVLVTSHQAFFTREALQNIAKTTLRSIFDFSQDKPLQNEVKSV
ncbi:MAG: 2-hydroxyacid dehydrogenase [Verrucomicrobia bacterium]|nr:2-hydroxyacid dehydrogenase [Verrucomicrobiota bacterium]